MSDDKKTILVVGDVMVDRYTYVQTERQAPEAPIPVWDVLRDEYRLGGAANVAHNLKALGGDEVEVHLAGVIDHADRRMISSLGIETILCAGTETMVKHRYVKEGKNEYLFRSDSFKSFSSGSRSTFLKSLDHFLPAHRFDAVILSDYNKGTICEEVVQRLKGRSDLNVVDSKRVDLKLFEGFSILKVNEHEYSVQVSRGPYTCVESLFDYVVVTKGKKGSELRQCEKQASGPNRYVVHTENFPVISVPAKDVTGCGDTHTAAMTFSLVKNNGDVRSAVKFANACARNVVQKFGTSVVDSGRK